MKLAMLMIMSTLFAITHIGMSHGRIRAGLIEQLGTLKFKIAYYLVSLITFGGAVWLFAGNRGIGPLIWSAPGWLYPLIYLLVLMGLILLVLSFANPSPAGILPAVMAPRGVLRITRHPMNMGIALFALAHMLANGSLGDLFFFGSLFVVGFFGVYHQDRRMIQQKGEEYRAFTRETGIFPFAAIIQGKTKAELKELSLPMILIAVAGWIALIIFHEKLFGAAPY